MKDRAVHYNDVIEAQDEIIELLRQQLEIEKKKVEIQAEVITKLNQHCNELLTSLGTQSEALSDMLKQQL